VFHTILLSTQILSCDFHIITRCLSELSRKRGARYYANEECEDEYVYELFKNDGIIILMRKCKNVYASAQFGSEIYNCSMEVRLNPKRLLEVDEYVQVAQSNDYEEICVRFTKVMRPLHKKLMKSESRDQYSLDAIECYRVKRIDYCVNIRTEYCCRYIDLIRKAAIPPCFELVMEMDQRAKRRKPHKQCHYIKSQSVVVNIYNKDYQMNKEFAQYERLEDAENIIRVEIQCHAPKTNNMKQQYGWASKEIIHFIDPELVHKMIFDYYKKSVGFEDYYSLDEARRQVEATNFRKSTKKEMIELLELISRKRSVPQALEAYCSEAKTDDERFDDLKRFNKLIRKIKESGINPVTIPASWKLKYLPNLVYEMDKEFMPQKDCD